MIKNNKTKGTMFDSAQLKRLIYPLIIEQVLAITVGMADTVMISYAGEAAMSGVSLVDMINNLLLSVFAAIATGGAVVVSQYLGHRELSRASAAAAQLVTVAIVIASGFSAAAMCGNRLILRLLFGTIEPDVMESASIYFLISAWSYPFIALFNACAAIFRSMGNAKISMKISVGINLMNAAGNALLIFGFSMGAAGAALSTFTARVLGALVILYFAVHDNKEIRIRCREFLCWDREMVHRILHIAIPSGVENGIFQLGRVIVVSIIAMFGTTQIAANAVANTLDSLGIITGQAMNLAMITVIGQCMGAGEKEQAVYYTKLLWKITSAILAGVNLLIVLTLPMLLKVFSLSAEAYHYAYILVTIHNGMAIILWSTSFTLPNALRAAGDVRYCMFVSVFSMFAFRVLLSVLFGVLLGWGAIGVWVAMIIDWTFRSTFFVWRFLNGKWLSFRVI